MPILFSQNSEILILGLIGLVLTVIEGTYLNLNESLREVWKTGFPEGLYSIAAEHIFKSIMSGIVLVRGITVHIYLASFLLMIYPVLKERMRVMLLMWMIVAGLRCILVNVAAAMTGAVICASYPELHPACFRFLAVKASEIACSVYLWVIVNDFFHSLRRRINRLDDARSQIKKLPPGKVKKEKIEKILQKMSQGTDPIEFESLETISGSEETISESTLEQEGENGSSFETGDEIEEESESSFDSMIAKAAVNWFLRQSLGMRYHGWNADRDAEIAQKFLNMSSEDMERLVEKLKEAISHPINRELGGEGEGLKLRGQTGRVEEEEPDQGIVRSRVKFRRRSNDSTMAAGSNSMVEPTGSGHLPEVIVKTAMRDPLKSYQKKRKKEKMIDQEVQTDEMSSKMKRRMEKQEKDDKKRT